jgi:uncharacterized protein
MSQRFTWDDDKAAANQKKHGVSFAEAQTVFDHPLAVIFEDEAHSDSESREIIIGHSARNRLVLVLHRAHRQYSDHQRPWSD